MKLAHLALTVIEDPLHEGRYHWLLLTARGDTDQVQEFGASDQSFASAHEAFEAGAARWRQEMSQENEDADPVGGGPVD
ncbi:hypothetical protein [Variovorax sp. EBFNA2]|uniref:hypothetical protein n=1 Tax=Variovorax sp. EBFNA2 TaxID=3342097 RepID=UPI0029C02E49|nr:hypothetical protein [Variovorax boronicumulans]WPG41628.1 hypothetical protein RZE79_32520 [Variovorax boronicumulans]